ncbi:hypothetical protein F4780DRAFT_739359 [Xylariomycetidae sp. FL0641]|nr:hypothetical protein F4780DRAFT_739359 [Xylariomycetidae sp. FL0641]
MVLAGEARTSASTIGSGAFSSFSTGAVAAATMIDSRTSSATASSDSVGATGATAFLGESRSIGVPEGLGRLAGDPNNVDARDLVGLMGAVSCAASSSSEPPPLERGRFCPSFLGLSGTFFSAAAARALARVVLPPPRVGGAVRPGVVSGAFGSTFSFSGTWNETCLGPRPRAVGRETADCDREN